MWDHLIEHLMDAGRADEAEAVACDLRWVGARLERFGPAAPAADLSAVGTARAVRLQAVLERTAHLLAPGEVPGAVVDVLHSRVVGDPDWGPQVMALREVHRRSRLVNRWTPPDLPGPGLQRVLTGHTSGVIAVAVAPDGSWLVTGSWDGTVLTWDTAIGRERAVLVRSAEWAITVVLAVAPDGSWLAIGGLDGKARIWDTKTGRERAVLVCYTRFAVPVVVVAAPDGSWLVTGCRDGTVRIWDTETWRERPGLGAPIRQQVAGSGGGAGWQLAGHCRRRWRDRDLGYRDRPAPRGLG